MHWFHIGWPRVRVRFELHGTLRASIGKEQPDVITWVLDARGAVVFRNQEWADFTGIYELDLRSRLRFHSVHPDDYPTVDRIFEEALKKRLPFLISYRMRKADQTYAWVVTGGSPSHSPVDGQFVGYFGTTKPISDKPASSAETENTRRLMPLDAIAEHLMNVRTLAESHGHEVIAKALDLPLLLTADLISRAIGKS